MPEAEHKVSEPEAVYTVRPNRHKELIELFDGLPRQEQDALMQSMAEKKSLYDEIFEELLTRRNESAQHN